MDTESQRWPWVIIGCGYTGTRLARRLLAAGARVWATRRTPEATTTLADELGSPGAALSVCALDLATDAAADAAAGGRLRGWLPAGAVIVVAAPPGSGGTAGEEHVLACAHASGARRIVYVSSTGVYPPGDGSWVDEHSPVGPASDRGRARLAAETAILEGARSLGVEAVALRVAGIYGPGRGVPTRLHRGTYRIIGDGDTFVSRVHVDDLVSILVAAGAVASVPRPVYNVADHEPATSRAYAEAVAEILGVPRPPSVPASAVDPWIATMLGANRRITSRYLARDLGVALAYPTWREGLAQVMAEEGIPAAAERDRNASG